MFRGDQNKIHAGDGYDEDRGMQMQKYIQENEMTEEEFAARDKCFAHDREPTAQRRIPHTHAAVERQAYSRPLSAVSRAQARSLSVISNTNNHMVEHAYKRTLAEQLKAEALELMRKRKLRNSQELDTSSTDDAYNVAPEGYKMSSMDVQADAHEKVQLQDHSFVPGSRSAQERQTCTRPSSAVRATQTPDAWTGQAVAYGASLIRVSGTVRHVMGKSKPYEGVNG